ncbi:MAG: hypothetical protein AAGK78_04395 [Planctomycetota bacterium]
MQRHFAQVRLPLACAAAALLWFLLGINWGLPTRDADAVLFGDRTPWTGHEILELAGGFEQSREVGADVDLTPADKDGVLNATDAQRAQIVRRYRLFTQQPDEWNTLRSLATMRPGEFDFDPKLYQYGGLWIYGVGGLLGVGHVTGTLTLTGDLAWYLDRPEEFGKLYIAARLWVVLWAAAGAGVMCWIMRRLSGATWLGLAAAAGWCLMPVVVYASREAKPHLPSAVCMFVAIGLTMRYWDRPTWKRALAVGLACGGAAGFVLSGAVAIVIPPVMAMFASVARKLRLRDAAVGVVTMLAVYAVTNPYAVKAFVTGDGAMAGNVGATVDQYKGNATAIGRWLDGAVNGLSLMWHAATPGVIVLGMVGLFIMLRDGATRRFVVLLIVTMLSVVGPYLLLAAGRPAEHARFALFADAAFLIPACWLAHRFVTTWVVNASALVSVLWLAGHGLLYQGVYVLEGPDGRSDMSGLEEKFDQLHTAFEPAPWSMPPVDLWHWEIRLREGSPYEKRDPPPGVVTVRPVDHGATRMSWANKRIEVKVGS